MRVFRHALQSINQNKLRSAMAGFGIAWGVFLLIIFLGIGNGFKAGVMSLFDVYAQKSIFVYGGQASVATSMVNEGGRIQFDKRIVEDIVKRYPSVKACSPEISKNGAVARGTDGSVVTTLTGVDASYFTIKILKIKTGRAISPLDVYKERDVAVIGEGLSQSIFGVSAALGRMLEVDGVLYKVVGVLSSDELLSVQERNSIYIPFSAYLSNYDAAGKMPSFCFSLSPTASAQEIEQDVKGYLAYRYGFDPHDGNAIYVANIETQTASFEQLFNGIEILIWFIGVCLLLSGIVGVCNVMLIIVKERTNEIGIRKAIGATSGSIITMILSESVMITFMAGIIGATLGCGLVYIGNELILPRLDIELIQSLALNIPAIIAAIVVLCLSGVLSGLFPAIRAAQITPVEAIRYENRE